MTHLRPPPRPQSCCRWQCRSSIRRYRLVESYTLRCARPRPSPSGLRTRCDSDSVLRSSGCSVIVMTGRMLWRLWPNSESFLVHVLTSSSSCADMSLTFLHAARHVAHGPVRPV
ncbi:hypothetical protein MPTK1_3g06300 [Marchantia polymorpha subsp. ruderalis]|uniref:Uncharacterized protein n=2 Tax=Marchantia polymorpha TaxID=3197 RepID=A0AAF6AXZ8_MARPO|nr:hypothetical protein MARPO_0006s0100 [Marchantia polymorpha]BBN04632.1 hypothetical protein Mp_3g06300 [Marchantia polymorpha subsp. ruderalis]|eukprot:PTQ48068.1 hypothetical protein MARPO_0006s0100 [Marchantia polymorpha]